MTTLPSAIGFATDAGAGSANVPDRDSLVPERRDENPVADEDVMHERIAHLGGEDLSRRRWVGQIDDHQTRWVAASGIDRKKCVELSVDALDFRGVHARSRERRSVSRDELRACVGSARL